MRHRRKEGGTYAHGDIYSCTCEVVSALLRYPSGEDAGATRPALLIIRVRQHTTRLSSCMYQRGIQLEIGPQQDRVLTQPIESRRTSTDESETSMCATYWGGKLKGTLYLRGNRRF